MEKNSGEEELELNLSYGAGAFDMVKDAEGNYHSAAANGMDNNWKKDPFGEETASQTADPSGIDRPSTKDSIDD